MNKSLLILMITLSAGPAAAEGSDWFGWKALHALSWEYGGNLDNRLDGRLGFSPAGTWSSLDLRLQMLDRRPTKAEAAEERQAAPENPFGPHSAEGPTVFGGGLYHGYTGSRLLFGTLEEFGLASRMKNMWNRSLPYPQSRKPSMADLKTTFSAEGLPAAYAYLGSPALGPARVFGYGRASPQNGEDTRPLFGTGADMALPAGMEIRTEGYYTEGIIPAREADAWFSPDRPLPERAFRNGGGGLLFSSPLVIATTDIGSSQTFAEGNGIYGGAGVLFGRTGTRSSGALPFAVSLAADSGGEHYTGTDGESPGASFRLGNRFEWFFPRSGLFRAEGSLRAPAFGKAFTRGETEIYFRMSGPAGRGGAAKTGKADHVRYRFTRAAAGFSRNADDPAKKTDKITTQAAFTLSFPKAGGGGKIRTALRSPLSLSANGSLELISGGAPKPVFGTDIYWPPGIFQLRSGAGFGDDFWSVSFGAGLRVKHFSINVKTASPEFRYDGENRSDPWNFGVTMRVQK